MLFFQIFASLGEYYPQLIDFRLALGLNSALPKEALCVPTLLHSGVSHMTCIGQQNVAGSHAWFVCLFFSVEQKP